MLGIIWRILIGNFHSHIWQTISTNNLLDDDGIKVGTAYYLRCTKCGEVKKRKFY